MVARLFPEIRTTEERLQVIADSFKPRKHTYSTERLVSFDCGMCGKKWSIVDGDTSPAKRYACPDCFYISDIEHVQGD